MLRIVLLFVIIMFMSFIPDNYHDFFGDYHCHGTETIRNADGSFNHYEGCEVMNYEHGATWHWGFRHWVWMLMGLALFIYNAVLLITEIDRHNDDMKRIREQERYKNKTY